MLILTLRQQEDLIITTPQGDEIVILFCALHGYNHDQLKLGIDAETSIRIERRVVYERRKANEA